MDIKGSYVPSHFLAMFCPKEGTNGDNRHFHDDFLNIAKTQPDISLNTENFIVYLIHSPSTHIAVDHENRVTLILHGEIYNTGDGQAEFLLKQFIERGIGFSKNINGSFAVLLIDDRNDAVTLITDRISSRKVFYSKYKDCYWLSTSLNLHPTDDVNLDPIGVAHYLASGAIHNNRTLFDGIRVLERACIHKLREDGFHGITYWSYEFTNSYSNMPEDKLQNELSELLVESVRLRLYDNPKVFLSLSGGYDSTGILGILGSKLKIPDVYCFSYGLGRTKRGNDEHVAREMATSIGFKHRIVRSYKGNLVDMINLRTRLGGGMVAASHDEVAAYLEMSSLFSAKLPSVLFVAEHCFGYVDWELDSNLDALKCVRVYDFSVLSWLRDVLPERVYNELRDGLNEDIAQIVRRWPSNTDYHDSKDFFFLDQRLCNSLLPWREFFIGQFVTIRNPFLDNSMLDFMMKIPSSLRRGKRLYIETVKGMFPDLFRIRRASRCSYLLNWKEELKSHLYSLRESTLSQDSKLDRIIEPELILRLLARNERNIIFSPKALMNNVAIRLLRESFLRDTFIEKKVSSQYLRLPVRSVNLSTFLKRVLLVRSAVTERNSEVSL